MKTANHRKTHKVFSQKCVIGGILEELQITSALIEIQDHEIIAIHKRNTDSWKDNGSNAFGI